jgi:hypothetical protein
MLAKGQQRGSPQVQPWTVRTYAPRLVKSRVFMVNAKGFLMKILMFAAFAAVLALAGCGKAPEAAAPTASSVEAVAPKALGITNDPKLEAAIDEATQNWEPNPSLNDEQNKLAYQKFRDEIRLQLTSAAKSSENNLAPQAKAEVKCSNVQVKNTAAQIIQQRLAKNAWFREMQPDLGGGEISHIKTTAINEALKTAECSAIYSFAYKNKPRQVEFEYTIAAYEDNSDLDVRANASAVEEAHMAAVLASKGIGK